MLTLTSKIDDVPKIGPKYKFLLSKLDITTVEDLLYHIPFRYEDYSKVRTIDELQEGDTVTIKATLNKINNIHTRNRKKMTIAKISDDTGKLSITWFNQHFIIKNLQEDEDYFFSGKVQKFNNKLNLVSPNFMPIKEKAALARDEQSKESDMARLVPVYPETKGVTSKWLNTRINDVLGVAKMTKLVEEFLPKKTLKKQDLISIEDALNKVHLPKSFDDVDAAKKRIGFEELFLELLKVEKRKRQWKETYDSIVMELKAGDIANKLDYFMQELPFSLTNTQKKAIDEILQDMQAIHPMNRLLEGDVGAGKTIVAIAAAYLAHLNGYKTLYMAPTEVLANQHFETFQKFLDKHNVNIKLITGNSKNHDIHKETNDIIIGTHALLYQKEPLQNVGLVVIDEQHRFGVAQRTKIAQMGTENEIQTDKDCSHSSTQHKKPHLLTMTATPIPRTLALTLYGDLSISVLDAVPNKDKKITTKVVPEKFRNKAFKWIKANGGQTFIVCPFIQESEAESLENVKAAKAEYERLTKGIFADTTIGLLHGKMKPQQKEVVLQEFKSGKLQVLVSTPVIEVGVDIPEATIMVIESAERYGLASLHQLRGRVGRGTKEGFCFVFSSSKGKTSYARLKNLENVDSGLKLAEIDLTYRGHGDLFGTMQHGFRKFRVAKISNLEFLEKVKLEAQTIYKDIQKYPKLEKRVKTISEELVGDN